MPSQPFWLSIHSRLSDYLRSITKSYLLLCLTLLLFPPPLSPQESLCADMWTYRKITLLLLGRSSFYWLKLMCCDAQMQIIGPSQSQEKILSCCSAKQSDWSALLSSSFIIPHSMRLSSFTEFQRVSSLRFLFHCSLKMVQAIRPFFLT